MPSTFIILQYVFYVPLKHNMSTILYGLGTWLRINKKQKMALLKAKSVEEQQELKIYGYFETFEFANAILPDYTPNVTITNY